MNWFKSICLIFLIGFSFNACSQSKKIISPKTYTVYKTQDLITIDGKADEAAWESTEWSSNFIDIAGVKIPEYQTIVKMLWDENHFYILAKIEDPHVWADIKQHDAIIYHNNNFEVFIDPDGDTHNYYELEINALNTVWDLFITKPYREFNSPVLNDWHITGLKSAVYVDGTLNNDSDVDKGWTLEIAIPWSVYKTSYYQDIVPRDKFWRVNFSRVNWNYDITNGKYSRKKDENEKYLPEYNWVWSSQGVINMHEPEKWGYVYFSSKEAKTDAFTIPDDEKIKWAMYELFRKQKAHHNKYKTWITSLIELQEAEVIINDEIITLVLENHKTGFNLTAISPFTKKELILTEDGKMTVN
tara:strand:- start:3006 stop:4076 length:1071 start_codon:yes stop_codon:yes gene_type:complete